MLSRRLSDLVASLHELDAVALIGEAARRVEELPAAILTLRLVGWRAGLLVAGIADAVAIGVPLVGVGDVRTVISGVGNAIAVRVYTAATTAGAATAIASTGRDEADAVALVLE